MQRQSHEKIYCACGGKCEGKCREIHLYRKRTLLDRCPAAYEPKAASYTKKEK